VSYSSIWLIDFFDHRVISIGLLGVLLYLIAPVVTTHTLALVVTKKSKSR
jgi:hypothetical protein